MGFREEFLRPRYDDAPHLSDQLLLPNLANGHTVYLASAFSTSYIFKLARDLADSDEIEPGKLHLTFFVPGDLRLKSVGISRFKSYLGKYAVDDFQVAQFVADALQLYAEGNFTLQIAHTSSNKPLLRGCVGVIVSSEDPEPSENSDYVAFIDAKGGDYNSPVEPLLSWNDEQYFHAQEILEKVSPVINGTARNSWLITQGEAISWLEYLDDWFDENLEADEDLVSEGTDDEVEDELDVAFLDHLQSLDEFANEDQYEWVEDDSPYEFDLSKHFSQVVEVSPQELEGGHVPPLPANIRPYYGSVGAVCPSCREFFNRADGCPSVDWNYRPDWYEDA